MTQEWLLDKSAVVRLAQSPDGTLWFERINRGLLWVGTPTLLGHGYSARPWLEWKQATQGQAMSLLPLAYLTPAAERRAVEVQGALARVGRHRAPSVADLLVAAIAEANQLTLLHVDEDFDLIAGITGQPVERLRM